MNEWLRSATAAISRSTNDESLRLISEIMRILTTSIVSKLISHFLLVIFIHMMRKETGISLLT